MLKFALLTSSLLLLASCQSGSKHNTQHINEADSLAFSYVNLNKQLFNCDAEDQACVKVTLQRIELAGEGENIDSIQNQIDRRFANLYLDTIGWKSPEDVIDNFLHEYEQIIQEMPDYNVEWTLERIVEVNFNRFGLFGLSIFEFSYTGGAHGNTLLIYQNFKTENGAPLGLQELFTTGDGFLQKAENVFRSSQHISASTAFEDAGFWFDDGFYVPDNFFLSDKGVHFFYNPYEIAPYASGSIELFMSWEELQGFLADDWAFLPEMFISDTATDTQLS